MKRYGSVLGRLKIAHLFIGMMFWYGIEQLFLNKYLGTDSARAYLTIAFMVSLLVFDVPSGIFADKFGRKRAMLLSCLVQVGGLVVLGSSNSLLQYVIGSVVFGFSIALLNGASQALLYDHLKLQSLSSLYGKHQGGVYAYFLVGAGIANFASGFIAHRFGLRTPFYLSIIPSTLAYFTLLPIADPPIQKVATKWYKHLSEVLYEIKTHPRILLFGLQFTISTLVLVTVGEFGQIYLLSYGIGTVVLGVVWSVTALFAAGGRYAAHYTQNYPRTTILVYCVVLLLFVTTHSILGIVLFWIVYGYNEVLSNTAEVEIQDETKSSMRATLFSTVSFAGNVMAVPVVLFYNHLYIHGSIFSANAVIGIAAACVLLASVLAMKKKHSAN